MAQARKVKAEGDFGLTLEDLFAETLSFQMTITGKPLTVEWSPNRYTPAVEDRVLSLASDDEDEVDQELEGEIEALVDPATLPEDERAGQIAKRARLQDTLRKRRHDRVRNNQEAVRITLCKVLASWSLTTNGVMVPIDEEHLRAMPPAFLMLVFDALWENVGPKDGTESLPEEQS